MHVPQINSKFRGKNCFPNLKMGTPIHSSEKLTFSEFFPGSIHRPSSGFKNIKL